MFVVLYRWRIKTGSEQKFAASWATATEFYLKNFDSLGSRLHIGSDGIWYGYAQWKSAEQRDDAFRQRENLLSNSTLVSARAEMDDSIEEILPEIRFEIVSDYLQYPEKNRIIN